MYTRGASNASAGKPSCAEGRAFHGRKPTAQNPGRGFPIIVVASRRRLQTPVRLMSFDNNLLEDFVKIQSSLSFFEYADIENWRYVRVLDIFE